MRQVLLLGLERKEPTTSSKILKSIKKVCRSLVRSPSPKMLSSNVSSLYSASIQPLKKTQSSMDELRYLLLCQKRQKIEALSPTSDSFIQHIKRANYQILRWGKSLVGNQDVPEPQCSGWKEKDGVLCPILMTSDPIPESIIELTTCNCKKLLCRSTCSCANNGLCCTEACFCMAQPGCTTYEDFDSEEEDDTP